MAPRYPEWMVWPHWVVKLALEQWPAWVVQLAREQWPASVVKSALEQVAALLIAVAWVECVLHVAEGWTFLHQALYLS